MNKGISRRRTYLLRYSQEKELGVSLERFNYIAEISEVRFEVPEEPLEIVKKMLELKK